MSKRVEEVSPDVVVWHVKRKFGASVMISLKADFQSVLRTLESLFTTFVLFHVRRHKM